MNRRLTAAFIIVALTAVVALALAGWATNRVQSLVRSQSAMERQTRASIVALTPNVNGKPATMADLVQAIQVDSQQLGALKGQLDTEVSAANSNTMTPSAVDSIVRADLQYTASRLTSLEDSVQCLSTAIGELRAGSPGGINC